MTGTDLCVNKPHKSLSYLNHLVYKILLLTQCYYGEEMRMRWMGHMEHIQENLKETDHLEDPGIKGTILQDRQHTHNVTFQCICIA
jgi:hypothetical protein